MRNVLIYTGENQQLVTLLSQSGTRFMVIGGTAVRFHNPARRQPNDLDIVVEPSPEAWRELNAALTQIGAPTIAATPSEFAQPNKRISEKRVCNVDIMTPFPGFNFAEHWAAAEAALMEFSSTCIRVASIETMKLWLRHALTMEPTRAKDIADDLALLERVL